MRTHALSLAIGLAAGVTLAALAQAPAQQRTPDLVAARIVEEHILRRVADTLDHAVDTKNWTLARAQFADRVALDMSSLGGPRAEVAADELVAGWQRAFRGDKTSLHLRTNHLATVDSDAARMTSHGYAWNRLPEGAVAGVDGPALWEVWGQYDYRFARISGEWRITHFTFVATHDRGPRAVPAAVRPE